WGGMNIVSGQVCMIEPGANLFESLEMVKDQRLVVHEYAALLASEHIICHIPRGEGRPLVSENDDSWKRSRPLVQILLIRIAIRLGDVVTPFQAPVAPPVQAGEAIGIATERDPADIEPAIDFRVSKMRSKSVRNDRNGTVSHLVKHRFGRRKEE